MMKYSAITMLLWGVTSALAHSLPPLALSAVTVEATMAFLLPMAVQDVRGAPAYTVKNGVFMEHLLGCPICHLD